MRDWKAQRLDPCGYPDLRHCGRRLQHSVPQMSEVDAVVANGACVEAMGVKAMGVEARGTEAG